jgi:hypothetical protein
VSLFIEICLLGKEKIQVKDFGSILNSNREDIPRIIKELGFKLIDFIGIILFVLVLSGIIVHIILRMARKK